MGPDWSVRTGEGSGDELKPNFDISSEYDLKNFQNVFRILWYLEPCVNSFEYKKRLLLSFKSDLINNMDHIRILGTEPKWFKDFLRMETEKRLEKPSKSKEMRYRTPLEIRYFIFYGLS